MTTSNIKLKQTFDIFDRDGSGSIETEELSKVLEALGQKVTESQLEEIVNALDSNGDGQINFEEFSSLSISIASNNIPKKIKKTASIK